MITVDKSRVRILVVDDEESIRNMLLLSLKEDGWNVEMAANGKMGLEAVSKSPFHIVISDIQMPEMTGIELLEAVKKTNPLIEFVVMTSNATLETAMQAIKLGAYDYVTKPFEDLSVVSKKMMQVSEKVLLRQQNNELVKRLRKAGQDLKRLFELASEFNGILDEENLQKSALAWGPKVFSAPVGCYWFEEGEKWKLLAHGGGDAHLEVGQTFESLDEIKSKLSALKSPQWTSLKFEGQKERVFAFESPVSELGDIFAQEVRTCFDKVMRHQDVVSLANRDGLTRLFNHRYFQDRLRQELSQVKRQNGDLSVLLLDVDNFKKFNDTHGHPAGDQLLRELGMVLDRESARRDSDIVARYGGEEFVFILPFTDYQGAMIKGERIREAVEKHRFGSEAQPLSATISIGAATFPQHAISPTGLIELADKALYEAKSQGRNRLVGYESVKKSGAKADTGSPKTTLESVLSNIPAPELPPISNIEEIVNTSVSGAEVAPVVVVVVPPAPEKPKLKKKQIGPEVDIEDLCTSIESAIEAAPQADSELKTVLFKADDAAVTPKEGKNGTGTEG